MPAATSLKAILDHSLSEQVQGPQWCRNRRQNTFYSENFVNTYGVKSSLVGDQGFSPKSRRGHRALLQVSLLAFKEHVICFSEVPND